MAQARGPIPERTLIPIGQTFYSRGELFGGVVAGLPAAPGLPDSLTGGVLALAIHGDSLVLAVLGPPDAPGDSGTGAGTVTYSGIALFGKWAGDSIAGDWQASSDTSGTRGAFVLRRP